MKLKRIITFFILLVVLVSFCGCKNTDINQDQSDSESGTESETEVVDGTLLERLTGSNDINGITEFQITHGMGDGISEITDTEDFKCLENYVYYGKHPADRLHELFLIPKSKYFTVTCGDKVESFYLLQDGSIAFINLDIYKAPEEYMLNEERFIKILKKHNEYHVMP